MGRGPRGPGRCSRRDSVPHPAASCIPGWGEVPSAANGRGPASADGPGGATARLTIATQWPGTRDPLSSVGPAPTVEMRSKRADLTTNREQPGASVTGRRAGQPGRRGRSTARGHRVPGHEPSNHGTPASRPGRGAAALIEQERAPGDPPGAPSCPARGSATIRHGRATTRRAMASAGAARHATRLQRAGAIGTGSTASRAEAAGSAVGRRDGPARPQ